MEPACVGRVRAAARSGHIAEARRLAQQGLYVQAGEVYGTCNLHLRNRNIGGGAVFGGGVVELGWFVSWVGGSAA